jgi:hypothetical protein
VRFMCLLQPHLKLCRLLLQKVNMSVKISTAPPRKFRKLKRDSNSTSSTINQNINNLYVEYLIVLDSTTLDFFYSVYGNMGPDFMNIYIKNFFIQNANGFRYILNFYMCECIHNKKNKETCLALRVFIKT